MPKTTKGKKKVREWVAWLRTSSPLKIMPLMNQIEACRFFKRKMDASFSGRYKIIKVKITEVCGRRKGRL